MVKKTRVLAYFGNSVEKTAEFFDILPSAVYQWKRFIPRERELELYLRLPEHFQPPYTRRAA